MVLGIAGADNHIVLCGSHLLSQRFTMSKYVLKLYAPGDGARSFVWLRDGIAGGKHVRPYEARRYLARKKRLSLREAGYQIMVINSQPRLVMPVIRTSSFTVRIREKEYIYSQDIAANFVHQGTLKVHSGECQIFSTDVIGQICFFLNHEEEMTKQTETHKDVA